MTLTTYPVTSGTVYVNIGCGGGAGSSGSSATGGAVGGGYTSGGVGGTGVEVTAAPAAPGADRPLFASARLRHVRRWSPSRPAVQAAVQAAPITAVVVGMQAAEVEAAAGPP